MRSVESFELVLSGSDSPGDPDSSTVHSLEIYLPEVDLPEVDLPEVDLQRALEPPVSGREDILPGSAENLSDNESASALRLLLTFDGADRLHLPKSVISARLEVSRHRFIILFEDAIRREELAFPIEVINAKTKVGAPDSWIEVLNLVQNFKRIVVVGLSSEDPLITGEADAHRPDQSPVSPGIVIFGDVSLEVN